MSGAPTQGSRAAPPDAPDFPTPLQIEKLEARYGERHVLTGLSLALRQGEVMGLLGPNGSGKSTALAILSGIRLKSGGRILFAGREIEPTDRAWRSRIGVVFQSPSLDVKLTARENLDLAGRLQTLSGRLLRERVAERLEWMGLADRAGEKVSTFSGGMRRRLDIARALMHDPEIVLMDEPSAGLDEFSFRELWDRLNAIRRQRTVSILLATHRPDEAERCDRLAVLSGGREEIVETPAALRATIDKDMLILTGPDPRDLCERVWRDFQLACLMDGEEVLIECRNGHELIPRLVESLGAARLASVSLRRPSLADVFLKITGTTLGEGAAASKEAA